VKENQSVTQKSYLGRTEFPDCIEIDMFEEPCREEMMEPGLEAFGL
jgi:hypothetical protein